jgi:type IV pilus assembly protein PilB
MLSTDTLRTIIVASGFVSPEDFDVSVKAAKELGKDVTDVLAYKGFLTEDILGNLIAEYYKVPYVDLSHKTIPSELLTVIPEEAALTFRMIPFELSESELSIAMEDPSNLEAKEFVKRKTGYKLKIFYVRNADLSKAAGQYKRDIKEVFDKIISENIEQTDKESKDVEKLALEVPVIRILDIILEYAVAEGASDVHFESEEDAFVVRFRIDGVLRDIVQLPKTIHDAITARIKILSQLKIDEHRIPQDGRFKFKMKDSFMALRVSVLPTFYGENIVLRLLAESARPLSFEELGLTSYNLEVLKRNIVKPHGMILVTGPTGSGKTTTLYSVLTMLNSTEVKLCTVEDPVEYGIKRVNQTQINPAAGLTFAAGLRALLRHDPDIIMVGEIRDKETAEMAIHSSLTGHLVLSTLHTNDAAGTIPRFIDMGTEGFLLASTLNVVIAQRLVRKLCTNCIESYTLPEETRQQLHHILGDTNPNQTFYKSKGCSECGKRGYKGRIGIFEILEVNESIRQMIVEKVSADTILKEAISNGMIPLLRDGINKASGGLTSIEEVMRVVRE